MPLNSSIVAASGESFTSEIDARWTMAYAAALGDLMTCYMDTLLKDGVVAHPMFPVCFEWPVILGMREIPSGMTLDESRRGVHASHDLIIHRPIRPPMRLRTRATIAAIEQRKPGAFQLSRLETTDDRGELICTSWYGSIVRDVAVTGNDRVAHAAPEAPAPRTSIERPLSDHVIPVAAGLAHIYTECARIFNPIHTDAAVARAAGLPEIILHGTATLALAVSKIVAIEANSDPARVRRIAGRFGAMVMMPSEIQLRILARETDRDGTKVFFDVLNAEGGPAIRNGLVILNP